MNRQRMLDRHPIAHESFPGHCLTRGSCCMRCGGNMQEGFLVEPPQGFEPALPMAWHAGGAESHAWTGAPLEASKQRRVVARRCDDCGGLELFAL